MSRNYIGIDYGSGMSNIDKETGIRFGVISCNSIMPEAQDDFEPDYGTPQEPIDCPECGHGEYAKQWGDDLTCSKCGEEFSADLPDCCESNGWTYEQDGYVLSSCLDNDCMVLKSPYYTYAQFCSPCVPGAGNLDNAYQGDEVPKGAPSYAEDHKWFAEAGGWPKVYCLGWDWFDEYNPCPYPIMYEVKTNKPVPKP